MPQNQKEQWNQFIIQNNGSFLQSWQWGEFQKSLGRKIWRIEIEDLKGLVIKYDLPLKKNYLYCPRGPVGQGDISQFLNKVEQITKQKRSIFFKIEPDKDVILRTVLKMTSLKESDKKIQPDKTIILDISRPEQEILNQMHQKTRYNIRLAQRKGVVIKEGDNNKTFNDFINLLEETAKRDQFHTHTRDYYQKMLEILGKEGIVKLFLAKYQGKLIAANLVSFFGQTAIYLHGASDYNFRQIMAPHLLQWQAILEAKERGCKYYDFWGINEEKWPGVTRFKRGFNGEEIVYSGAFDLIFQPWWYLIYNLARKAS